MSELPGIQSLARVNGEPFTDLPQDLYIPPGALAVYLYAFEGPLDLLLYLIRRHNLDVLDIPMADITRQYMDYVERMRNERLDLAAEYLLMAALLIEIKSRMLLPRQAQPEDENGEAGDPRAELVRRLLEYEQMKSAAQFVENQPREGRDYELISIESEATVKQLPAVFPNDLHAAWLGLVARAGTHQRHTVGCQQLSVREAMSRILDALQGNGLLEFTRLFDPGKGISHLVVTFLAILELARECLLEISQTAAFAPIYIRLAHANQSYCRTENRT